jgi:hypothetical protein
MSNIITLIEDLNSLQQQSIIDILITVQEHKHISSKLAGLVGMDIEHFPVSELKRIFRQYPPLLRATEKLLAIQGISDDCLVNLKNVIGAVLENEIERRVGESSQKTLLDFAVE